MTNTFLYARVSTQKQAERDLSIPDQLAAMRLYVNSKGWKVVGEYVDEGLSGTTDRRPSFQRMIEDALSGCADLILVHSFSRLFREHLHMEMYRRKLEKQGIQISSLTEELGINDSHSLMMNFMSLFAEYQTQERARHRRRPSRPQS